MTAEGLRAVCHARAGGLFFSGFLSDLSFRFLQPILGYGFSRYMQAHFCVCCHLLVSSGLVCWAAVAQCLLLLDVTEASLRFATLAPQHVGLRGISILSLASCPLMWFFLHKTHVAAWLCQSSHLHGTHNNGTGDKLVPRSYLELRFTPALAFVLLVYGV